MPIDVYHQLTQALKTGPIVLATIVKTHGSVPREVGAKMIITAAGQIFNTIGGGAGEAKVIAQAKMLFTTGQKQILKIDLSGSPQRQTQGICGGTMQVWLERWQGDLAIALADQMLAQLQSGRSLTLITPWDENQSPFLLDRTQSPPDRAWSETIQPPPLLLIIGAGHCAIELAKVAHLIGFDIVVHDDRADWANATNFPQARQIATQSLAALLADWGEHPQLYAALVTRGYQYDLQALERLLQRQIPCQYIGMIGSAQRVRQVCQQVCQQVQGDVAKMPQIHAPIGLDIGALTPAEIAVSIGAELILVRRGGLGRSLSTSLQ
jgi:xanthine dehydrogenase accessory factor